MTLRILHAVASLAPRHGGPTEAALGMVRALRHEGVDARILSTDDDVGGALEVPLEQWTEHEGVPCYSCRESGRSSTRWWASLVATISTLVARAWTGV